MSEAQLFVVLGSGGVGKTTTAAALGLACAEVGYRTAVITVDPAKRLAQALGLTELSNEAREVKKFPNGGTLSALWLDTHDALEKLVRHHAPQLGGNTKILKHRLFNILQSQLGGIEEYLGVEKILGLKKSGDFDICVLDTPPSRHALDFLDSPRHLLKFFDEKVLKLFLAEEKSDERESLFKRVFQSGKTQALEIFKNFLGKTFLNELTELLAGLKPVQNALTQTALDIETWVRSPETRYITVSVLERFPLEEAHLLETELASRGLGRAHLRILNRALPRVAAPNKNVLIDVLGERRAAEVLENISSQQKLREALREDPRYQKFPPRAWAELPRYAPQDLNRENLLQIGKRILEQWQAQEAKIFSRPSLPIATP